MLNKPDTEVYIFPDELVEFFQGDDTTLEQFDQLFKGRVISTDVWYDWMKHLYTK